jgi:hypothetical protein
MKLSRTSVRVLMLVAAIVLIGAFAIYRHSLGEQRSLTVYRSQTHDRNVDVGMYSDADAARFDRIHAEASKTHLISTSDFQWLIMRIGQPPPKIDQYTPQLLRTKIGGLLDLNQRPTDQQKVDVAALIPNLISRRTAKDKATAMNLIVNYDLKADVPIVSSLLKDPNPQIAEMARNTLAKLG